MLLSPRLSSLGNIISQILLLITLTSPFLVDGIEQEECDAVTTVTKEPKEFWHDFTMRDLRSFLNCDTRDYKQKIHGDSTWMFLRGVYLGTVGPEKSHISTFQKINSYHIPFYVGYDVVKGRAIYASEFIPEGQLIYDTQLTARFYKAHDFRLFVMSLQKFDASLACDVLQWSWIEHSNDHSEQLISCDLDEGIFLNSGVPYDKKYHGIPRSAKDVRALRNVQNVRSSKSEKSFQKQYFAMRDIYPGEELLLDYGEFSEDENWQDFGL